MVPCVRSLRKSKLWQGYPLPQRSAGRLARLRPFTRLARVPGRAGVTFYSSSRIMVREGRAGSTSRETVSATRYAGMEPVTIRAWYSHPWNL
jgi:hypothetical protein